MAIKKLYIVTDLGPGDGGKGGVVHAISCLRRPHTILKEGGAQGNHGVATAAGEKFAFSQFGCATFEGVRTHLSPRFVATPEGILNEAAALRYSHGIHNVFDLLTVDEEVVCATPYHGIASRLKELARKNNPRGTVGTGVGEAYRYAEHYPELTVRARDLARADLRDLLVAIRDQVRSDLSVLVKQGFLAKDEPAAAHELDRLNDPGFLDYIVQRFREAARCVKVVGRDYLRQIFAREGVIVVERSHGVLTDRYQGFHPHTSALRTLPSFTRAMLEEHGYDGAVVSLGVTRAYQIRHGAGPMPTADERMFETLLPSSHKEENRYQGRARVGPLDLPVLRYAIAVSGGPSAFDGLAVTWFDQIQANGAWQLCHSYRGADNPIYFTPSGELRPRFGDDVAQLMYQEALGQQLNNCLPEIRQYEVPPEASRDELFDFCAGVLNEQLAVAVRMVSFGPTERDKVFK